MRELFRTRSYDMVKMFLNQFATSIFGLVLAIASGKAGNTVLRNVTSVCAIIFYLFLLYTMTWELGFSDRSAVVAGRKPKKAFTGVWLSFFANTVNWLLAIFILLGNVFNNIGFFSKLGGFSASAALFLEGMFTGLLANHVAGNALNSYWFVYFLLPIPSMLVCGLSYRLGLADIKFTGLFNVVYPESDREPKKKKKSKSDENNGQK